MIGISRLTSGIAEPSDGLRYAHRRTEDRRPIVVWNCTRVCNLLCSHCYSASDARREPDELTTAEALNMIEDLSAFGAPVLLFSGGEPLMRPDLEELISAARDRGLRTVLSTNGTLIDKQRAAELSRLGLAYAGVSLDAADPATNDTFRGRAGAFDDALAGIRDCLEAGVKVGLRFTMTRDNVSQIDAVFDLVEREGIPRLCFYHLVSAGRGKNLEDAMVPAAVTREAVGRIIDRTVKLREAGRRVEVLTVDNHADGPLLYMTMLKDDPGAAAAAAELLARNGGNRSGESIACISWDGRVYPDQFWRNHPVGDIRTRPFSRIWTDPDQSLLAMLRERKKHLRCRCNRCRFLNMCNGNLRARAEAAGNGIWGDDPACYLSDEDISGNPVVARDSAATVENTGDPS